MFKHTNLKALQEPKTVFCYRTYVTFKPQSSFFGNNIFFNRIWNLFGNTLGEFKNDVTVKMASFKVTVSHFFHYTPAFPCHQANSDKPFP